MSQHCSQFEEIVPFLCPGVVLSWNVMSFTSTSFFFLSAFFGSDDVAVAAAFYTVNATPMSHEPSYPVSPQTLQPSRLS